MAMMPFLAMTAGEIRNISRFPTKVAWMACHFSPYGRGLSNLPTDLPPASVLVLDDVTPPRGHDPQQIADQLICCAEAFQCCGVILDFQRADSAETAALTADLVQLIPLPIAVTEAYVPEDRRCAVLLSPIPPSLSPEEHLSPWTDRDVWLELSQEGEILTLTEQGCRTEILQAPTQQSSGFADGALHCHYAVETRETSARFTLWRTEADMLELVGHVHRLGVVQTVGLYQELGKIPSFFS